MLRFSLITASAPAAVISPSCLPIDARTISPSTESANTTAFSGVASSVSWGGKGSAGSERWRRTGRQRSDQRNQYEDGQKPFHTLFLATSTNSAQTILYCFGSA